MFQLLKILLEGFVEYSWLYRIFHIDNNFAGQIWRGSRICSPSGEISFSFRGLFLRGRLLSGKWQGPLPRTFRRQNRLLLIVFCVKLLTACVPNILHSRKKLFCLLFFPPNRLRFHSLSFSVFFVADSEFIIFFTKLYPHYHHLKLIEIWKQMTFLGRSLGSLALPLEKPECSERDPSRDQRQSEHPWGTCAVGSQRQRAEERSILVPRTHGPGKEQAQGSPD